MFGLSKRERTERAAREEAEIARFNQMHEAYVAECRAREEITISGVVAHKFACGDLPADLCMRLEDGTIVAPHCSACGWLDRYRALQPGDRITGKGHWYTWHPEHGEPERHFGFYEITERITKAERLAKLEAAVARLEATLEPA